MSEKELTLEVLFADDRDLDGQRRDMEAQLREHNISANFTCEDNVEAAIDRIKAGDYDLAIVDLHFEKGIEGNDIIREILSKDVFPIIVYSEFSAYLDQKYKNHAAIRTVKMKKSEEAVKIISELWHEGIFSFFSERRRLAKSVLNIMNEIFWKEISFGDLNGLGGDDKYRILGRILSLKLHQRFLSDTSEADPKIFHKEVYLSSWSEQTLSTGSIIKTEEDLYEIILTPNCNLIKGRNNSALTVLTCKETEHKEFNKFCNKMIAEKSDRKKSNENKVTLAKWLRHAKDDQSGRYFFLPPTDNFNGAVFDFLSLNTYNLDPDHTEYDKLVSSIDLTLSSQMAAELSTMYARFMSRLGQMSYNEDLLFDAYCKIEKK